jgi:threonyl-tRNA synthetase
VFSPKGALVRHLMEAYSVEKHLASGYQLVWTPHLARSELFETSGHLQWYQENMYPPMEMEGVTYYPKPMNCPLHISLYANKLHSYKELPLRLFEFGTVYRFERSGVLHGLTRVRGLTQDDSHIFCAPEQLGHELTGVLEFVVQMLGAFGLREFDAELATRPDKFVGDIAEWNFAEEALRQALGASGIDYSVAEGEGAFYAPKIDIHLRDAIGRRWQVSTIQVDLQLPQRFDLSYIGPDNTKHRPFMLHRALFGSVERFMAILIEHYAGALPTWLSPVQVKVLAVRDTHEEYAKYVVFHLRERSFRAEVSLADEPLGARVRSAKLEKIPYVLVVGDDDVNGHTVGVNARGSSKALRGVGLEEFYQRLEQEVVSHG